MFPAIDEFWFRGSFIVAFGALVIVWGRSFVLGGITSDSFWNSIEGFIPGVLLRLLLTASIIGMSIYSAKPLWMNWSRVPLPHTLRLLGIPLAVFAILLLLWAQHSLGPNFCATLRLKKMHTLVTDGPYRWVRHPMYSSFILLWIAYFFLSANWFIGVTGIFAEGIIVVTRTPKEERMMVERFGDEYIIYMRGTGRFFPRRRIFG